MRIVAQGVRDGVADVDDVPYRENVNHAEGITVVARDDHRVWLMVIYDSAGKNRRASHAGIQATIHELRLSP